MWELLNTSAFAPFVIAAFVLLILLAVEMLGFFFGGLSGFLDNLLPESLVDADFDADMSLSADSDISLGLRALDWLYVGRIPTMILLILFIASFCITGFLIQQLAYSFLGYFISPWLASLDALVVSFPLLKITATLLYPILPKDESTAVSGDSLIGRSAQILIGHASIGHPAQAKIIDEHGQSHFVMIEPEPKPTDNNDSDTLLLAKSITSISDPHHLASDTTFFSAEDKLIITQKIGGRYLAKKL